MLFPLLTTLVFLAAPALLLEPLKWLLGLPGEILAAYESFIRWGADSVRDLFEDYGYWVVFFGTLAENTLLLGLIVPGAIIVILAGLSAENGTLSLPVAYVIALTGTVLGDTISYCLGRFGWSRLGRLPIFRDVNQKVGEPLLKRGATFVLVYHFAGYTRVVGPTVAGFLKMPFARWAPADYCGAALWLAAYMGLGYGLGALGFTLDTSQSYFRYVEWVLLVFVMVTGYLMLRGAERTWSSGKAKEEEEAKESAHAAAD